MPSTTFTQRIKDLNDLIDSYEKKRLKKDIAALKRQFWFELIYSLIAPAFAAILTAVFTNLAVMLAPIGVGVANIAEKFLLSKTILSSYFKDKHTIESRPDVWRAHIGLAQAEQDESKKDERLDLVKLDIDACYPSLQT